MVKQSRRSWMLVPFSGLSVGTLPLQPFTMTLISLGFLLVISSSHAFTNISNNVLYDNDCNGLDCRFKRGNQTPEYCDKKDGISIGFVIDTTTSMNDEMEYVKEYAVNIINDLVNAPGSKICDLVLVPTHDEIKVHETGWIKTRDPGRLKAAIRDIKTQDGLYDCPEKTMIGIEMAADLSLEDSYLFVFTDADPKDADLLPTVIQKIRDKRITINLFLTGFCGSDVSKEFRELSKISNAGFLMNIEKDARAIQKRLDIIKNDFSKNIISTISGRPTGKATTNTTIPISPGTKSVSIKGGSNRNSSIAIELRKPDGTKPKENIITLSDDSNFKAIEISDPIPGLWTVLVNSPTSPFKLVVLGADDVIIAIGFTTSKTDDMKKTSRHPQKDFKTSLLVEVTEPRSSKIVDRVTHIEIAINDAVVSKLDVKLVDREKGIYRSEPTIFPNEPFKIRVIAITIDGFPFNRESKTTIEPQEPGPPFIDCKDTMVAPEESAFNMTCLVESFLPVEVQMLKKGSTNKRTHRHAGTTEVFIHFPFLRSTDKGYYEIHAKNSAGNVTKKIYLEVLKLPPKVLIDSPLIGRKGNRQVIDCMVESWWNFTIQWSKSNSSKSSFTKGSEIPLTIGGDVTTYKTKLIIYPLKEKDEGWYICSVKNEGGTTVEKSYLEVREEAEVEIVGGADRTINFQSHETISLSCRKKRGKPSPKLTWYDNFNRPILNGRYLKADKDRLTLTLPNAFKGLAGSYSCWGENSINTDIKFVKLQYIEQPVIIFSVPGSIDILAGNDLKLMCHMSGIPVPEVTWSRKRGNETTSLKLVKKSIIHQDKIHSSLTLPGVELADTGSYYCAASNLAGKAEDQISVNVGAKPTIQRAPEEISVKLHRSTELPCNTSGVPTPVVEWRRNRGALSGKMKGTNYLIQNADIHEEGEYICISSNTHGFAESRIRVKVVGGVPPEISKTCDYEEEETLESITIKCNILKGYPSPTVVWQHNGRPVGNVYPFSISKDDGSLTISPVGQFETGKYACIVQNKIGEDVKQFQLRKQTTSMFMELINRVTGTKTNTLSLECIADKK